MKSVNANKINRKSGEAEGPAVLSISIQSPRTSTYSSSSCRRNRFLDHRRLAPGLVLYRRLLRKSLLARSMWREARTHKLLVVDLCLVGIIDCKLRDGFNKSIRSTDVAGKRDRIPRACVTARQQFAANLSILVQSLAFEIFNRDRRLVIIQLPYQVMAIVDRGPAEKEVGLELHRPLALDHPVALVLRSPHLSQVRGISRVRLLLDLQEERIVAPVAFHIDDVIAQPNTARAHHLEGDVERAVQIEEVLALRQQTFAVLAKRVENEVCLRALQTELQRLLFDEDAVGR